MPKRVVGLIGKGTGPKIFVGGPASVEILQAEVEVEVTVFWPNGGSSTFQYGNGRHVPIDDCHYVQFSYGGNNKSFVGNVHLEG